MRIEIEFKPANKIRNEQLGDYFYKEDGTLVFHIAETGNEFYNKLILLHELFEEATTKQNGIKEETISDYDEFFEKARSQGLVPENMENGYSKEAPYRNEHTMADSIERLACAITNTAWVDYEHHINNLQ
jgi:hypothetical protein